MDATFWALMPPVVAIVLALITKEVYVSLLIGILAGGLFYANFNVLDALETTFTIMGERVGSNTNIIVFLVLLGMLVALMSKSGASRAYGSWASRSIKTKRGRFVRHRRVRRSDFRGRLFQLSYGGHRHAACNGAV